MMALGLTGDNAERIRAAAAAKKAAVVAAEKRDIVLAPLGGGDQQDGRDSSSRDRDGSSGERLMARAAALRERAGVLREAAHSRFYPVPYMTVMMTVMAEQAQIDLAEDVEREAAKVEAEAVATMKLEAAANAGQIPTGAAGLLIATDPIVRKRMDHLQRQNDALLARRDTLLARRDDEAATQGTTTTAAPAVAPGLFNHVRHYFKNWN